MNRLFDTDYLKELWDSITRNKSRSFLTGFGVFWGIFMLLALSGGAGGLKELITANFAGFATNSAFIVPSNTTKAYGGFRKGRLWNMNTGDIEAIRAKVPEIDAIVPIFNQFGVGAAKGERSSNVTVRGTVPEYYDIEAPKIKYGRRLSVMDIHNKSKVCVIGKRVYEELFPEGGDPCGQFIKVQGINYLVVGVDFATRNITIGASGDQTVSIPFSIYSIIYATGDQIQFLAFTVKAGARVKDALEKARAVLSRRHSISPDDKDAMMSVNSEAMFSLVDNMMKGVDILILLVGLGTILAGAIGVSNIMMVTVKERTTEIGIRRAIGATPKMILGQIVSESIILTIAAGLMGLVLSVAVLGMAELAVTKDGVLAAHFQIGFWAAVGAVLGLAALGVAAGLPPALRAMGIKPVDAMRDE